MASKRHIRKNKCTGKIRYLTAETAQAAVYQNFRRFKQPFTYYHCQFCKHYHVGHNYQRARSTF